MYNDFNDEMFIKMDIERYKKLVKNNDNETVTDYEKCRKCTMKNGGRTYCSMIPCELYPDDLVKIDKETIKALLETGMVIVDCLENVIKLNNIPRSSFIFFLRMRTLTDKGWLTFSHGKIWSGYCVALDINGKCKIQFKRAHIKCYDEQEFKDLKYQITKAWLPYQELICDVLDDDRQEGIDCRCVSVMDCIKDDEPYLHEDFFHTIKRFLDA